MSDTHIVQVGAKGRVVLPAPLRRQLRIEEGSELVALIEGEAVVLLPRDAVGRRLQAMFADVPGSLADGLAADRRAEVEAESRP
ncbi:MAG: AbrB/MazE/SpoVT family DNA-binding domain-containing protein [Acidimicrobiia bacterium]